MQNVGPALGAANNISALASVAPQVAPPPVNVGAPIAPLAPGPAPAATSAGTMNQLLTQIMSGPNAPSPQVLAVLVNTLAPPPAPPPIIAPPPPPPPPVFVPVSQPPPPQPPQIIQPPPNLPPQTFNPTCQTQVSPSC